VTLTPEQVFVFRLAYVIAATLAAGVCVGNIVAVAGDLRYLRHEGIGDSRLVIAHGNIRNAVARLATVAPIIVIGMVTIQEPVGLVVGWRQIIIYTGFLGIALTKLYAALADMRDRWVILRSVRDDQTAMLQQVESAAFIQMDQRGRIMVWNPIAEDIFGWTTEEAVGKDLADLVIPERYRARHRAGLEQFRDRGDYKIMMRRFVFPGLHKDGHEVPCLHIIWPTRVAKDEWVFFGYVLRWLGND